jgi:hypothetical protein
MLIGSFIITGAIISFQALEAQAFFEKIYFERQTSIKEGKTIIGVTSKAG